MCNPGWPFRVLLAQGHCDNFRDGRWSRQSPSEPSLRLDHGYYKETDSFLLNCLKEQAGRPSVAFFLSCHLERTCLRMKLTQREKHNWETKRQRCTLFVCFWIQQYQKSQFLVSPSRKKQNKTMNKNHFLFFIFFAFLRVEFLLLVTKRDLITIV